MRPTTFAVIAPLMGVAPMFVGDQENPRLMWRRGLLPRKWRSTRCGCPSCRRRA